jgi:hypothetical protein
VMSGRSGLQTERVKPSTRLKASPTCCAARFTHGSSAVLSFLDNTFERVSSLGSRPKSGNGWQFAQHSATHFLGAKQRHDRSHKKVPGAQSSRGLSSLHGFGRERYILAHSLDGFPRGPLPRRPGPLVAFGRRLAAREGKTETHQNETAELELNVRLGQDRCKPAPQRVFNGALGGVSHTGTGGGRPRNDCDLATSKSPKGNFVTIAEVATAQAAAGPATIATWRHRKVPKGILSPSPRSRPPLKNAPKTMSQRRGCRSAPRPRSKRLA